MSLLIANGADVNARDYCEYTVLMKCFMPMEWTNFEKVGKLLSAGADPHVAHGRDGTVFDLAKHKGTKILEELQKLIL